MSREYNVERTRENTFTSVMGHKEPVAHPQNCRSECPYGHGRSFCFPCMAKIMSEHNAAKKAKVQES